MQLRKVSERYRLEKILKSSRSATVLRAVEDGSGRTVAIKLIPVGAAPGLDFEQRAEAFSRLAAALASPQHPSLPAVLDSGFTPDGSAFLVLEHLDGQSLEELTGLPSSRALPLLLQAASGLEALASQGLAHHNLSPANVLVVSGLDGEGVKLLGLGTAILRRPGPNRSGEEARFLAPELGAPGPGESPDGHADLYSLALTACHLLGATATSIGSSDLVVQMPLAVSFELENPEALRQTLERCLRRHPAERPSHQGVRYALQLALEGAESSVFRRDPLLTTTAAASVPSPAAETQTAVQMPPGAAQLEPFAPEPQEAQGAKAEPEELEEVLLPIDDDVLDALVAATPPPAPEPAAPVPAARVLPFLGRSKTVPAPPAPKGASPALAPAEVRRPRRRFLLGAAAAVLLLAAAAVLWSRMRQPAPPTPAPPAEAAAGPTLRPAAERLEEARLYLAKGEDERARQILRSFSFADQASLPPETCERLRSLEETLTLATRDQLPGDLAAGLETGNLARLRAAVEAASALPQIIVELPEQARADFERARDLVDLYTQTEAATVAHQHAQVLERFAAMLAVVPELSDPQELRKKAAAALEAEAEALVLSARYQEAIARLEPLRRTWPDRLGLEARLRSYAEFQQAETEQKALLDTLPAAERRKKPHEGLEAIAKIKPTPHLAPRFAEVRRRLESLLAQLDQTPPQVALRDGYTLTYARGNVATLSFRVTDDYMVRDVKMMLRPPGGKMREVPLERSGFGYTVEILPSLHQNGTVEFYVTATDLSGHEGFFGTREQPLTLIREQGFQSILR